MMPLFIGEFGASWKMQPSDARDMAVNEALKSLESSFIDNAYWDYSVREVDIWNEEDFSIIDKNGKLRGLKSNVRPYLRRLSGTPKYQSFDPGTGAYSCSFWTGSPSTPAEFYLPGDVQYAKEFKISVSDGRAEHIEDGRKVLYYPTFRGNHSLSIRSR